MARKCTYCREEIPRKKDCTDPAQKAGFCSLDHMSAHGLEKGRKQIERKRRQETREAKERLKTKSEHLKEAQAAFNAYIRARDEGLPCISCGRNDADLKAHFTGGSWDCGHYRSIGACPELRFEPLNAHRQCKRCNRDDSGNVVEYRIGLIKRIGQENAEWLEGKHEPAKYTIEDAKRIKAYYRQKAREINNQRGY